MKINFFATLCIIFFVNIISGNNPEKDSLHIKNKASLNKNEPTKYVSFPELDEKFPTSDFLNFSSQDFTFKKVEEIYPVDDKIIEARKEAQTGFLEIEENKKWISSFGNEDIQELPIGIKHGDGDGSVEYAIGITKAIINPNFAELTVFARIRIPQSDGDGKPLELFFGANNVKLSREGGIVGDANLVLLGDVFIPYNGGTWMLTLKGGFDYGSGFTTNKTYVTISCDGVDEIGIEGEVQFSREVIVPVNDKGEPLPAQKKYTAPDGTNTMVPNTVSGAFDLMASDWNDLMVTINLPPFALASSPDMFVFSANDAVFDFSDVRTENVVFPQFYYDKNLLQPTVESWRGVYIKSLRVGMPTEFKTNESAKKGTRVYFNAANMIIDNHGISGYFSAENVFPLSEGRTSKESGWAFSVDRIGVELASNSFIKADFAGRIVLPISDVPKDEKKTSKPAPTSPPAPTAPGTPAKAEEKDDRFGLTYVGIITEEDYLMRVGLGSSLDFSIWNANVNLTPNSSIELKRKDGEFYPKAVLNGTMVISANIGDKKPEPGKDGKVKFEGIKFQNLVLQKEFPEIEVDYFGYEGGDLSVGNFPVSIPKIGLISNKTKTALQFEIMLNLMGEGDKGFAASTTLEILGKYASRDGRKQLVYDKVELKEIMLKAKMAAFSMEGKIIFMNDDPEYGDGFKAELKVQIAALGDLSIAATAMFGKKEFRYWYFDMMVDNLPQTKPIGLKGIGGGAFYRMERRGFSSAFSPSGLAYVPNGDMGLGLKAMVLFSVVNEKAVNGGAGFEILFNKRGGVNKMGFYGEAHIMQSFSIPNPAAAITDKMKAITDASGAGGVAEDAASNSMTKPFVAKAAEDYPAKISGEAGVNGYIGIEYDFENEVLHGELDIYVNVAGGVVQGKASGGRAGWAVIHLAPDEWYLHMGTPQDRLGLRLGIGPVTIEAGGYFMIGDTMPDMAEVPPEVAQILGKDMDELNFMRNENDLGSGGGFAFGHDFKIDTGDLRFLILYARFMAGGGFDIMLKDYGEAACANTGDQVGINGWYASGQAYTYLQGELGIRVKLFALSKKVTILKGAAAAIMQAKGPNPIWMKGSVGGSYNVLGGLVKGSYSFDLTLGEECELINVSPIGGIKLISDITPNEGSTNVDVFAIPQAVFSFQVNKPIVIPEDDAEKTYKVLLEKFDVLDASGNKVIGELEWNAENDRANFVSKEILPESTRIKVVVEVSFQEKIDGVFRTIEVDGQAAIEHEERNFTTGKAPTYIPLSNIVYMYPIIDQEQFYVNEYDNGYVQLQRGQQYLFDDTNWTSFVRFTDESADNTTSNVSYNANDSRVGYNFPGLRNNTKFALSIVSIPKNGASNNLANSTTEKTESYDDENTMTITTKDAENVSKENGEIERLAYEFKSSEYNTFTAKVNDIRITDDLWSKYANEISEVILLSSGIREHIGFDYIELAGNKYTDNQPLVRAESTLTDKYFTDDINPMIYQKYGADKQYTIKRDTEEYGFAPKKAVNVIGSYLDGVVNGTEVSWRSTYFPFRYDLTYVYNLDFMDIQAKVINAYLDGDISDGSDMLSIVDKRFLFMRYGNYDVKLRYVIPGDIETSSPSHRFKNLNKFR